MENLVALHTKEFVHLEEKNSDVSCTSQSTGAANNTNSNENEDHLEVPNVQVQPSNITISTCRNYVAGINQLTNELVVYRYEENQIKTPACFTNSLYVEETHNNQLIFGWNRTHLGRSRGLTSEENVALRQVAVAPFVDSGRYNIGWSRLHGDKSYICVNAYTPELKRYLAVFGVHDGSLIWSWHERLIGHKLGEEIAWRPRCNQVAIPFQSGDGNFVGIWERGALVRGMQLGMSNFSVRHLQFSKDGFMLLIWQQMEDSGEGGGFVAIYFYSGGGWLKKQQVRSFSQPLIEAKWASSITNCNAVTYTLQMTQANKNQCWIQWGLRSDVTYDGDIILINGKFVNITRMNVEVLPPGMYSLQIELPWPSTSANQVFLHESKPWIAILCDRMYVHFYDRSTGVNLIPEPVNMRFHRYMYMLNGEWINNEEIWDYVCSATEDGVECQQFLLTNSQSEQKMICTEPMCRKAACLHARTVASPKLNLIEDIIVEEAYPNVKQICDLKLDDSYYTFKLDFEGNFFINNVIVSKEINSICLDSDYLFLSAYKTLYYFNLAADNVNNLLTNRNNTTAPPSVEYFAKTNSKIIKQRRIEVQAKVLTGSVGGLVLVMPRGNFELLQIPDIGARNVVKLMNEKKYKEAVLVVYLLNLDPNVLIDSDIKKFVANAKDFVKEVSYQSITHILIQLKDGENSIKRNKVCLALRAGLLNTSGYYGEILPLLSLTYLQITKDQNPFHAIVDISSYLKQALSSNEGEKMIRGVINNTLHVLQSASKQHFRWFDYALRMGDLKLAAFVASYLRMDPKQYEPFLHNLKLFYDDKYIYLHHVSKFIGDYDEALQNLLIWYNKRYNCETETEAVVEFVREKGLCRKAVDIMVGKTSKERLQDVNKSTLIALFAPSVAEELMATNNQTYVRYAAALYYRSNGPALAENAFTAFTKFASDIAISITNAKRDAEANICDMVDQDNYFAAILAATGANRADLIDTIIKDAMTIRTDNLCLQIDELRTKFNKMYNRLLQLRENFQNMAQCAAWQRCRDLQQQYPYADDEDADIYQDTASMATTFASASASVSSKSSSSRRRKRRAARNANKVREGHPRENINIVRVLHEDIKFIFDLTPIVTEFYITMISHPNMTADVYLLIQWTLRLQKEMIKSASNIWMHDLNLHLNPLNSHMPEAQMKRIVGLQHNWNFLEMKFRVPPENMKNSFRTINSEHE